MIDDAIVVVENIVLHRDAGQDRLQAIHSALQEITVPLIGSTVTPVVVFLPLISITGVTGTFFRALAVTMAIVAVHIARAGAYLDAEPEPVLHSSTKPHRRTQGLEPNQKRNRCTRLLAAEEASIGGFFRKVVTFHQRWLRRALAKPLWLAG